MCINSTCWLILHPQGPNLGAIHSLHRHPNTSNTPRSCPQDKTIKTSTHLQSAGGVSAVELTPRRRYLYTTSTMYCTRRCNCYLYTTSDQDDLSTHSGILKRAMFASTDWFIIVVVDARKVVGKPKMAEKFQGNLSYVVWIVPHCTIG